MDQNNALQVLNILEKGELHMFKILLQTVFSILSLSGILFAKEYPLERTINLTLSNHNTTVLEFPFKIADLRLDPFKRITYVTNMPVSTQKDEVEEDTIKTDEIQVPKITETKTINGQTVTVIKKNPPKTTSSQSSKSGESSKSKPIEIKKSKDGNIIEIRPNETGSTKAIVWGYKEYPIMININIAKNNSETNDYYKFVDFSKPKEDLVSFEGQKHETIIKKLLYNAYLEQIPKGYNKKIMSEFEEGEKYLLQLNSVLTGENYNLKSYTFVNTSEEDFKIDEKMFYQEGNVYAVSIEKLGRIIKPQEKTRVFIVLKKI
jgi:hypothetical protein